MGLIFEWLIAVIVFPVNMLVIIPAIVLYYTDYTWHANNVGWTIVGVALLLLGLVFTAWTTGLFARKGKGTAAPWCPPKNLIVEGPYAYVRNPMIISMFAMQNAEC
ncbi:MAG: hypothetical protein LBG09_00570, partial [Puniceicoccales bacterium]|nr:hypothetical protein [Puniceicoccales bacterium]